MLTPQEIRDKSFVKAVFGGYDMSEVDDFLDQLSDDYIALYKENAVLKSKMKVLVSKIEEYKKTEETISMTLLSAQKSATDLLENAKAKVADMIKNAEAVAIEKSIEVQKQVRDEERRLAVSKKATADFIEEVKNAVKKLVDFFNAIPSLEFEESAPEKEEGSIVDAADEIENSVLKILNEEDAEIKEEDRAEEENEKVYDELISEDLPEVEDLEDEDYKEDKTSDIDDADEDKTPKPRFNFENLKFGKEYEVK